MIVSAILFFFLVNFQTLLERCPVHTKNKGDSHRGFWQKERVIETDENQEEENRHAAKIDFLNCRDSF